TPARQTGTPARQTETPARRAETPARQTETPVRQNETPVRQNETPARQSGTPARQSETSELLTSSGKTVALVKPESSQMSRSIRMETPLLTFRTPDIPLVKIVRFCSFGK